MKITVRQIEGFLAVAEFGNFSLASRRLNTAQPALSQAIKDLEAELGVRLFDRTTRRVVLTDAGSEFRTAAVKIMEELEHAVENAKGIADRRRGRLRIAAPPLLAATVLPPAIAEYRQRHPNIIVELLDVGTDQIVERVRSGKADCGVGTFAHVDEGIQRLSLAKDSLMAFYAEGQDLGGGSSLRWADLATRPIVTLTRESGIRLLTEVGFEAAETPFAPAFEVAQITTALSLAEAGLGVAILPTYAVAAIQRRNILTKRIEPSLSREIAVIHATGRSVPPVVPPFIQIVRNILQRWYSSAGLTEFTRSGT